MRHCDTTAPLTPRLGQRQPLLNGLLLHGLVLVISPTDPLVSPVSLGLPKLIFAVCSTDTTEGPDQVEMFLRSHPDFTSESPVGLPALPNYQGHLRTLPGPEGLDGFFAARLRKMY